MNKPMEKNHGYPPVPSPQRKKNHLWKQKNVTVSRLNDTKRGGWINIWNESTIINHH